jgi:hypothetical protein
MTDVPHHLFAFHRHVGPNGDQLIGSMALPKWSGPGCPPGCSLPKAPPPPPPEPVVSKRTRR